jgi:hypothetical protein
MPRTNSKLDASAWGRGRQDAIGGVYTFSGARSAIWRNPEGQNRLGVEGQFCPSQVVCNIFVAPWTGGQAPGGIGIRGDARLCVVDRAFAFERPSDKFDTISE